MELNISREEIENKVRESIALALGLEEDEVEMDANIFEELGAESLDLLDINSRLQKAYKIRFPRDNFINKTNEMLGKDFLATSDGTLTDRGLEMLRMRFPELTGVFDKVEKPPVSRLPKMITPQTWVRMVSELLENKGLTADELNNAWLLDYKKKHIDG